MDEVVNRTHDCKFDSEVCLLQDVVWIKGDRMKSGLHILTSHSFRSPNLYRSSLILDLPAFLSLSFNLVMHAKTSSAFFAFAFLASVGE
jgi:hypothetical protein